MPTPCLHRRQPGLLATARGATVVTPHPGEMARLIGKTGKEVQADRFEAAAKLARVEQTVVVLKGAGTVVAAPDGRLSVNSHQERRAWPMGGTGDVLCWPDRRSCWHKGWCPFDLARAVRTYSAAAGRARRGQSPAGPARSSWRARLRTSWARASGRSSDADQPEHLNDLAGDPDPRWKLGQGVAAGAGDFVGLCRRTWAPPGTTLVPGLIAAGIGNPERRGQQSDLLAGPSAIAGRYLSGSAPRRPLSAGDPRAVACTIGYFDLLDGQGVASGRGGSIGLPRRPRANGWSSGSAPLGALTGSAKARGDWAWCAGRSVAEGSLKGSRFGLPRASEGSRISACEPGWGSFAQRSWPSPEARAPKERAPEKRTPVGPPPRAHPAPRIRPVSPASAARPGMEAAAIAAPRSAGATRCAAPPAVAPNGACIYRPGGSTRVAPAAPPRSSVHEAATGPVSVDREPVAQPCPDNFGCADAGEHSQGCASPLDCAPDFTCKVGVCVAKIQTGPCSSSFDCVSKICLWGRRAPATAPTPCNSTLAPCGAAACDPVTGACLYADAGTLCGSNPCTPGSQTRPDAL